MSDTAAISPPPDVLLRRELERQHAACDLVRPYRPARYETGDALDLAVTGVHPPNRGRAIAVVERFVGGGFAGQVYRVRLRAIEPAAEPLHGLEAGGTYAVKILRPPSGFANFFRDCLYFLGYQAPFSAQVHPDAMRVGVLWQTLIRRGMALRTGRPNSVCESFATFYDPQLRSFGEINEWVSGRVWRLEVDDELLDRWNFRGEPPATLNAGEYVHKKLFMRTLVELLHEMGAPELARQYEWWTCKSQPNVLKRSGRDDAPSDGLTAIDFRAGLALLPFAPMSPADVALLVRGLRRGRLVQFDRGDFERLRAYLERHEEAFADLRPVVEELRERDTKYRRSMPDITSQGVRLLGDAALRSDVKAGMIAAWENLGCVDAEQADRLRRGRAAFRVLLVLSFVPLLGRAILKLWGDTKRREHLRRCVTSGGYLLRAWRGARIAALIEWHRAGRVSDERARRLVRRPVRFWIQRILVGWMPATWHRILAEPAFAWERIRTSAGFMYNFLRNPPYREAWLLEQVRLGEQEGMLTSAEAAHVAGEVKDPFIQKYLRCLAAHICTVPVTQVTMVVVGAAWTAYCLTVYQMSWGASVAAGTAVGALIQFLPISPGSLARFLYVLYRMIRERDWRNYYIAAPVSIIHVVGYLAFPLQMVAHDPALARFLAARWAVGLVRVVPVFGEHGGLLEHGVFDFFFNLPISAQRGYRKQPLRWTLVVLALLGSPVVVVLVLPTLWYLACMVWFSWLG